MLFNSSVFTRFGFGQFTKPVLLLCLASLSISTIFTAFILTGATSRGLTKFYLISLNYNSDSTATKVLDGFDSLDGIISKPSNDTSKFGLIRVGYRGLCIDHTDGVDCAPNGAALGHVAGDLTGDPLDLVAIADIYRDRISFSLPIWVAVLALGVGWLVVAVNCVPGIPIPAWTKRIAAGACMLGSLALLGAMVLQQVTAGAVSTLVTKMGLGAVQIKIGSGVVVFGWVAFGFAVLTTILVSAIVAADWGVAAAQAKAFEKSEEALGRATGGRLNMSHFANDVENVQKPESTQPSLGTSTMRSQLADKAFTLGTGAAKSAFNSRMNARR